jgi:hypothetical protein
MSKQHVVGILIVVGVATIIVVLRQLLITPGSASGSAAVESRGASEAMPAGAPTTAPFQQAAAPEKQACDPEAPRNGKTIDQRSRDGVTDVTDFQRKHIDLVTLFSIRPDRVATRDLIRHVALNPIDHLFSRGDAIPLDCIIEKHVEIITPLIKACRSGDTNERIALIGTGTIPCAQLPRPSDRAIERFARQVSAGADDYKALLEAWMKDPPTAAMQRIDHINYRGKEYLLRDFPPLMRTNALRDELRFRSVDFLGEVGLWFCQQGVLSEKDLGELLERLRTAPF